ncbi:hypothetical protein GCM10025868_21870 [Angustibacter aerolatus]|uniref:DUF2029 domain-containing protein n=1 Tax=Angustibacter aerolatus TaxID=1162965 RepID=A0ABQ6JFF7_9ACTN|nr:hypothetical protein [Angustibacter aerolatus]GMA86937.1 hypothetical protein GCM10025868_21870 [Angustibacter aerolatus]
MRRLAPTALLLLALGALLLVGTAALGPSAAEPSLAAGSVGPTPPWTLGLHPSSALVTVLLDVGYLVGAIGVLLGWLAARRGEVLPRWAVPAGLAVAALAVLVPPLGSADHVNYAAYGRIAAGGGDPYVVAPIGWAGGHDPVTSAVEAPWTTTPSIYGPVATLVQPGVQPGRRRLAAAHRVGVRLVCLASWVAVCRLATSVLSGPARERAAWLWPLNPVLLGLLVVGAHVDLLAAALGLGAVVLCARRPLVAGVLLGAAVGVAHRRAARSRGAVRVVAQRFWTLARGGARGARRRAGARARPPVGRAARARPGSRGPAASCRSPPLAPPRRRAHRPPAERHRAHRRRGRDAARRPALRLARRPRAHPFPRPNPVCSPQTASGGGEAV